jgi:hypothetical protein
LNQSEISEKTGLFSHTDDYVRMMDATRKNPVIHETDITSTKHFLDLLERAQQNPDIIPLLIKYPNGFLNTIPNVLFNETEVAEGYKFVYLGQLLDQK